MNDLISRKAALNVLLMSKDYRDAHDALEQLPAVDAAPVQRVKVSPLLFYLALYAPAPEHTPDDWVHHVEDNLAAWQRFVNEAQERGYYEFPIDDSTACGPDYCEIGDES